MVKKYTREDGKQTINWYKSEAFKEFKDENDNYDYQATDIKPNSRVLVCGNTGSGKTNSLVSYLKLSPNLFSRIIIVFKEIEPIYEMLNKAFDNQIEFINNLQALPTLKKLREGMNDKERILLVIDDWILDIAQRPKMFPQINDYFIYGRKKNVTLFFLSQDFYRIPIALRNQMTYMLFFNMVQKRDINAILSNFDNPKKELNKIYKSIVKEPMCFMKINTQAQCADCNKVSRNFTDFVEDFSYDE